MVLAHNIYQQDPGLYNFLGYTVEDFFVIEMQKIKQAFATKYGFQDAVNAPYSKDPPTPPPV
jgi:hypothetical protein